MDDDDIRTRAVVIAWDPADHARIGTTVDLPVEQADRMIRDGWARPADAEVPAPPDWYVRQQEAAGQAPAGPQPAAADTSDAPAESSPDTAAEAAVEDGTEPATDAAADTADNGGQVRRRRRSV